MLYKTSKFISVVPKAEICTVTHQALLNSAPVSDSLSNTLCKQFMLIFAPSCFGIFIQYGYLPTIKTLFW